MELPVDRDFASATAGRPPQMKTSDFEFRADIYTVGPGSQLDMSIPRPESNSWELHFYSCEHVSSGRFWPSHYRQRRRNAAFFQKLEVFDLSSKAYERILRSSRSCPVRLTRWGVNTALCWAKEWPPKVPFSIGTFGATLQLALSATSCMGEGRRCWNKRRPLTDCRLARENKLQIDRPFKPKWIRGLRRGQPSFDWKCRLAIHCGIRKSLANWSQAAYELFGYKSIAQWSWVSYREHWETRRFDASFGQQRFQPPRTTPRNVSKRKGSLAMPTDSL